MKRRKLRGSKTAGRGSGQNARKAGSKGGVGRAGWGKRGQQKMFSFRGTEEHVKKKKKYPLNLDKIDLWLDSFVKKGVIAKVNDAYEIRLDKLGYQKVCGTLKKDVKLIVYGKCSEAAKNSIIAKGGQVYE
jgi:ribosomal protein L15